MSDVVQIKCPHCQQTLRVPANWAEQPMRCKHCQQVFQAKRRVAAPAAAVTAAPVANDNPFAFTDSPTPVAAVAPRRPAAPPGKFPFKAVLLGGVIFLGVGVAAIAVVVVLGSTLLNLIAPHQQVAKGTDKKDTATAASPKDSPRDSSKGDPKRDENAGNGGNPGPGKEIEPPANRTDDIYPRRALLISVNDYLAAGPIAYGKPATPEFRGSSTAAFAEALQKQLDFPRVQIAELSDKAATPMTPQKAVIENTLEEFLSTSRRQDHILVFFAGHAVQIDKEAYLVPFEGKLGDPKSLIALGWLYEKLRKCEARQKVLILDICRFDPARGGPRPMGDALEARLKAPPAGIQVMASCSAKEQSWESGEGSLFLESLCKTCRDLPTPPQYAIPVKKLFGRVKLELQERTQDLNPKQTPLLAGAEPQGEGPFNAKDPLPPAVALKPAVTTPKTDTDLATLKHILDELALIPPTLATGPAKALDPSTLPEYAAQALAPYKANYKSILEFKDREADFPLRCQLARSILALRDHAARVPAIRKSLPGKAPDVAFKKMIKAEQGIIADVTFNLKDQLKELLEAGEKHRGGETKRIQVLYDFVVQRMKARVTFIVEYNYALAEIGKDALPPLEAGEKLYHLMSQEKVNVNEAYVRDYVKEMKRDWKSFVKTYAGTPWEFMAQIDQETKLGLAWRGAKQ
jgi:hypothetical protein